VGVSSDVQRGCRNRIPDPVFDFVDPARIAGSFGKEDVRRMEESVIRDTLERERAAALARVQALSAELNGIIADAVYSNADDEHDPEGSTIAYERARVTGLLADAQSHLDDLDSALMRLIDGSYSICEECYGTIPAERLEALPACRTCIECAVVRR
jgi:DnaK suppressor protein